jgi:hypothetical protein
LENYTQYNALYCVTAGAPVNVYNEKGEILEKNMQVTGFLGEKQHI